MLGQHSEFDSQLSPSYRCVMRELFFAWQLAAEVDCARTDFAVEIDAFIRLGTTHSEIRYPLCKGYLEHWIDCAESQWGKRIVLPAESLRLTSQSRFLLTAKGMEAAKRLFNLDGDRGPASVSNPVDGPHWDVEQRTLSFNGEVVQRFDSHAPAQEQILAAFEEEEWTTRIDDPLPPIGDVDRKTRLNKTIHRLNRHLRSTPIQFCSDGCGEGICWHENGATD